MAKKTIVILTRDNEHFETSRTLPEVYIRKTDDNWEVIRAGSDKTVCYFARPDFTLNEVVEWINKETDFVTQVENLQQLTKLLP